MKRNTYNNYSYTLKMKTLASIFLVIVIFIFGKAISQISDEISGFIVNGRDADIADFPHHLGLFNRGSFICGAAVINPLFALTAAHCLDFGTPPAGHLWGGSTSRVFGGHLFFVNSYYLHPQYIRIPLSTGQVIWDYDVAVIRVEDAFRGRVSSCLPINFAIIVFKRLLWSLYRN